MSANECPFCPPDPDRVFFEGTLGLAVWDAFPVADGHALVVLRRHVPSWFDATSDEQLELVKIIAVAKAAIESRLEPDGYTIGVNVGAAAGQTVPHLHIHVIPRFAGDVPDPTGGVRHVIPDEGNYLAPIPALTGSEDDAVTGGDAQAVRERGAQPASPGEPPPRPNERRPPPRDEEHTTFALVRGGQDDPLLPHLLATLDRAMAVDIAAAFILKSGVELVDEHLVDVLGRGGSVRILTGDYLGITEPQALLRLLDLEGRTDGEIDVRVYESAGTSFHPKAYIVSRSATEGTAFVGSSNLTATALQRGIEWNYRVVPARDEAGFREVARGFDELWADPQVRRIDNDWVRAYEAHRATRPEPSAADAGISPEPLHPPVPHEIQMEALTALTATREAGNTAGLVVLATGLGKTWLSAFDSRSAQYQRVLFVAHREEILRQAMKTVRRIRPMATLGHYNGTEKAPDADVIFASIQTLSRAAHLHLFDPKQFDYIVIDEFHHAAARSYRRLINHFEPRFLLGLTATPERTDGADLLRLCGDNLVYRADVAEGIRRGLLCPFEYYGVPDEVDYENIPWRTLSANDE